MSRRSIEILGHPVHVMDLPGAVEWLLSRQSAGDPQFVVAQNPEKIVRCCEDAELADIIDRAATLRLADGVGTVLAARLLGYGRVPRVPGVDLFHRLLEIAAQRRMAAFFYGGRPDVSRRLPEILAARYPGLVVAGVQHGYDDGETVVERIRAARPEWLFVGLGSPRQEKWTGRHIQRLRVGCAMGVGGSFDVLTGSVPRAPLWMRNAGLEWVFRVLRQPQRAGRTWRLMKFAWQVLDARRSARSRE